MSFTVTPSSPRKICLLLPPSCYLLRPGKQRAEKVRGKRLGVLKCPDERPFFQTAAFALRQCRARADVFNG
jgi:hypothetical protein